MPLSELWRLAAGKSESRQQRPCPADVSPPGDNDLVELVWENGQLAMQSQSGRFSGNLGMSSNTNRIRDGMSGQPSTTARIGKFGGVESILDDMSSVVPSGELDLGQDADMAPWLNYPIGDVLPQDYVSDLLPEISGVTANGMSVSVQNSIVSVDKRSHFDGTVNNLDRSGNSSKASNSKARSVCSWQVQGQHRQADGGLGSGASNVTGNKTMNSHLSDVFGNSAHGKDTMKELVMERPTLGLPSTNSNVLNFPYFSRPANIVKANTPNFQTSNLSGVGRTEVTERGWTTGGSNPFKSMPVDRSNGVQKNTDFYASASSSKIALADSRQPAFEAPKEPLATGSTEKLSTEPPIKYEKPVISSNIANPMKGVLDGDRNIESMVVSSSVGSGNSADRVSCEQTHNSKRKFGDVEESECRSDDIETISNGVKKLNTARGGNGAKRSRAAEVHNLSERRRRDRINEKMRALQELIPNCNKVDKASMLDEAIEYLKNLQLQVQIMSMGAGLYMPPPMMFSTGMQHMHPTHFPHFAPMGVGMGMGMGLAYGMGTQMPNATGGSPSCPVFPVPPMRFPAPGSTNFQGISAPNLPVYGHPSQGLHSSALRTSLVPVTGQPIVNSSAGLSALVNVSQSDAPSSCPTLNSVDQTTNKNSQSMSKAEASSSMNNKSNELEATKEVLNQSATVKEDKPAAIALAQSSLTSATETDANRETSERPRINF